VPLTAPPSSASWASVQSLVCCLSFSLPTSHLTTPGNVDHSPRPHPQSPTQSLPTSFAEYRKVAQQHGPLGTYRSASSGAKPDITPKTGEYFDRNELPKRFWRMQISRREQEIIESGGAAAFA
jgi:small subunit ribosomal protein YMR-31